MMLPIITGYPNNLLQCVMRGLLPCLLLTAAVNHTAYSQETVTQKKILVLFHNSDFSPFKQEFSLGLHDYIDNGQSIFPNVTITYEFLGLNSFSSETRPNVLIDLLKHNQQVDPAAVVISVQTPSAEFLEAFGDELYGDIPRVYALADPRLSDSVRAQNIANIKVVPSAALAVIQSTIDVIPRLLPDIEHLFVISGIDELDLGFLEITKSAVSNSLPDLDANYLTGLPVDELDLALADLPENSAIFLMSYGMDGNGVPLRTVDVFDNIADSAKAPVFSFISSLRSRGIMGGYFTNVGQSGSLAAELALSLLSGTYSSDPPQIRNTAYMFDQRQLERWGVNESLLPPGSIVENREPTFVELYARQMLILFLVVGVMMFFLVFLKRQAINLGKQKNLFESVIDSIPDAIIITDQNNLIFASNNGAKQVFGFEHGELIGMNTRELIDPAALELGDSAEIAAIIENSIEPQLVPYKKKNGDSFPGETIATQITSSTGETLGHFALIRDISKRLSMEEEQRQGQKMEALGNLVGGISHDFNNVLGVISGYTELLLQDERDNGPRTNLEQILKATDRAKSLVGQIMSFSRDSSSGQKPTNLKPLIEETMKFLKVSIPGSIEISVVMDDALRPVMGSAVQIQQIFMNLATNATQAMHPTGGALKIVLRREVVPTEVNLFHGVLAPGSYSVMSITDNGPGMSCGLASRVFEPFFTTKGQGEGSGMGLAIVYKLAKAHGAMVDMQTSVGRGTRIMVYFPELTDANVETIEDKELVVAEGRGESILLVDDEEGLLDSTQQLLSGIGYHVTAFSDPQGALEAFNQTPENFDLLVTDENMPKLTGVQLVEAVRKLRPHFPAIICTGYSENLSSGSAKQMDLGSIVRKPFTLEEISHCIKGILCTK